MVAYKVLNENTLGYINDAQPEVFCVLHGKTLLGGHDWINGPVSLISSDILREATIDDFDSYRVSPFGHTAEWSPKTARMQRGGTVGS